MTSAALVLLLGADLVLSGRRAKPVGMREAALWTGVTVILALGFGGLLAAFTGRAVAGQFYAGWLTEYSLSLDNLLVFALLINSSRVPQRLHGRVLMLGICLALVLRGVFIAAGAAALHHFDWLQYLFAAFLLGAAVWMGGQKGKKSQGAMVAGDVRAADWLTEDRAALGRAAILARALKRSRAGPFLLLILAIGIADVMFALDSIPAIFGLTRDPFVVFTANLFALIGLRHLYFLAGGLLRRLVHLSVGISVVLAFIGVKFLSEALRGSGVHHLGPLPVPHFSAVVSLVIIVGVMAVTAATSFALSSRGRLPAVTPAAASARPGNTAGTGGAAGTRTRICDNAGALAGAGGVFASLTDWRDFWGDTKPPGHNALPSHGLACTSNTADRVTLMDFRKIVELSKVMNPNMFREPSQFGRHSVFHDRKHFDRSVSPDDSPTFATRRQ